MEEMQQLDIKRQKMNLNLSILLYKILTQNG